MPYFVHFSGHNYGILAYLLDAKTLELVEWFDEEVDERFHFASKAEAQEAATKARSRGFRACVSQLTEP